MRITAEFGEFRVVFWYDGRMSTGEQAYVSLLEWPQGLTLEDRIAAISASTGLDRYNARLRAQREAPVVLARLAAGAAAEAAEELRKIGAFVFVATESQIRSCAAAHRAKALRPALGAPEPTYLVELWRDEPVVLKASELFLIVRGRLRRSERTEGRVDVQYEPLSGGTTLEIGSPGTRLAVSDLIDLWDRSGRRIRINGDKFNFDVLGAERGYSDNENADRLALRLASQAPRAMVDTSFAAFHCPPDILRAVWQTGMNGQRRRSDAPAFDFYSVWSWLMHIALAG